MKLRFVLYCVFVLFLASCGSSKKTTQTKKDAGVVLETYDPWVRAEDLPVKYQSNHHKSIISKDYDAVIFAVSHYQFTTLKINDIKLLCKPNHIICDLKYIFSLEETEMRL